MISKKQKRKIFIPKAANLRKCYVQLGQIDNILTRINPTKRKSSGKIGTPAPPGTKLIRVKSDLFRKTSTPLATSERASKRTPKPNRRYVNEETVITSTWMEKEDSSVQPSEIDDDDEDMDERMAESNRKGGNKIPGPRSRTMNKGADKLLKRKNFDEKPGPRQHKKGHYSSDDDYEEMVVTSDSEPSTTRRQKESITPKTNPLKSTPRQSAPRQVNSRARPLIKLPPTSKQKSSPSTRSPPTKPNSNKASPLANASNKLAKTKEVSPISKPNVVVDLEDFEQMPTFTIVNINDIINQKEEVVVIEKSPRVPGKKVNKIPTKKSEQREPEDLVAELMQEDDDFETKTDTTNTKTPSRRKTPHKVLSDQVVQPSATKETKPIPNKSTPIGTKPYRNIIGGKNNGKLKEVVTPPATTAAKQPPRILNSQLCTNADSELTSVMAHITSPKKTLNNNIKTALNRSKENIKQPVKPAPVTNITTISGGRKVRKITCFETWFVIKLPHIEPINTQSVLDIELIKLGNEIKEIPLPTADWNYKISLTRITKPNTTGLIYSGEVQEANIKEEERHFYQPTTIMFRRECKNKALRMQFDRAVIMKNRSFFINVDGKNVKLIGAPQFLQNFEDIETLLQIVENISLTDPLVEQTTYVI
ncbi:AF4/FMR2 family member 4 [Bradysia coprophila]|uniref:AF4/FMR2 family member 4 n=1 Tax=Bradysia coprophila TaxID=38358 RepID=UPI00187DAB64|nr:AF4/FMR2 family member 4 [Bradysia coprophila]